MCRTALTCLLAVVLLGAGCSAVPETPDSGHPPDASTPDSGAPDSGAPDSGAPDSGAPDSGAPDSGAPDSGAPDSGTPDTTPPDTTLVDGPLAISGPDVSFTVGSTEAASTFRCAVDSTSLLPCAATETFLGLDGGSHTFRAAAVDPSGNADLTPVERTWMVDLTMLDTTITMGPPATAGPSVQFQFTATRAGTFECQLSPLETQLTPCTSPRTYTALTEVPPPGYTFQVRARDTAGNLDATPASRTFVVDATGPVVTITSPANNATVGTSFTLDFTSEPGATHTCQLDNGAPIAGCTSPRTFSNLTSAMPHTIRVTGTDAVGNTSLVTHDLTVDDVGPGVTITGSPANGATVNTTAANLAFLIVPANEPSPFTIECRFDSSGAFTPCTGFVTSGLLDGVHTLEVRARDRFDNVGPVATHTWNIQPLVTTIQNVRTQPIALGTRVQINNAASNVRVTAKASNRFWVQEANGLATSVNRGITVVPVGPVSDPVLVPGRSLSLTGTVTNMNGNLVLFQATYQAGSLLAAYSAKSMNRTATNLLQEAHEGMRVDMAGRTSSTAAPSCQTFDYCILSCAQSVPVIEATDASPTPASLNADHVFQGIVEGNGTGYVFFVTDAQQAADACL